MSIGSLSAIALGLTLSATTASASAPPGQTKEAKPTTMVGYQTPGGTLDTSKKLAAPKVTASTEFAGSAGSSPQPRKVIGPDGRGQVRDTTASPYRRTGQLTFSTGGGTGICTAWLIAPRTALTAGHCVEGQFSNMKFAAGRNGSSDPFGVATVTKVWRDQRGPGVEGGDWGIVQLDRAVGQQTGWYGLAVASNADLSGGSARVIGYPGDKPRGTMWQHTDRVVGVRSLMFSYVTDTMGGQSGSAVTVRNSDVANGIHVSGNSQQNNATRITQQLLNQINSVKS